MTPQYFAACLVLGILLALYSPGLCLLVIVILAVVPIVLNVIDRDRS